MMVPGQFAAHREQAKHGIDGLILSIILQKIAEGVFQKFQHHRPGFGEGDAKQIAKALDD